uniref:5'-(N(7)-methylguanosine 5'-triphospho)-[mRNA] hydrolase n=1 Tax=Ornithorhynchus anatinus TaxID=9258 RepID=A0A6I8P6R6_ORNAN
MAAPAQGGGRDISLAALQRHDPYINRIVDVASQVALYTFGHRASEWEKTDVEGTLFVYTRSASPKHGFTIMNRLSMENRTEPITKDLDFQLQDPFLLYRNARREKLFLFGPWEPLIQKLSAPDRPLPGPFLPEFVFLSYLLSACLFASHCP